MDVSAIPVAIPAKAPAWLRPQVLDRIEQVLIALLWVWLVRRVIVSPNAYAPLMLMSETAVMLFVLIRRPTQAISLQLGDWLLAITATAAPLLIQPGQDLFPALAPVGLVLMFAGNLGQLYAKLALRRSFGIAPANRGNRRSAVRPAVDLRRQHRSGPIMVAGWRDDGLRIQPRRQSRYLAPADWRNVGETADH